MLASSLKRLEGLRPTRTSVLTSVITPRRRVSFCHHFLRSMSVSTERNRRRIRQSAVPYIELTIRSLPPLEVQVFELRKLPNNRRILHLILKS